LEVTVIRHGWFLAAALGAVGGLVGCDHSCTDIGCLGKKVEVALVDEAGDPVAARGEIRYSGHPGGVFDCTVAPTPTAKDVDCENDTLQVAPVFNDDDELDIRFELDDGSFSDWQPVPLTVEREVLADVNGPGCDCTVWNGTAEPVTVPAEAQLTD
jgi:hypothetical protein